MYECFPFSVCISVLPHFQGPICKFTDPFPSARPFIWVFVLNQSEVLLGFKPYYSSGYCQCLRSFRSPQLHLGFTWRAYSRGSLQILVPVGFESPSHPLGFWSSICTASQDSVSFAALQWQMLVSFLLEEVGVSLMI